MKIFLDFWKKLKENIFVYFFKNNQDLKERLSKEASNGKYFWIFEDWDLKKKLFQRGSKGKYFWICF